MDDNIVMEPRLSENAADSGRRDNGSACGCDVSGEEKSWRPSHILDFSDLSVG